MIFNILSMLVGFIGKRTFWRINAKDKIYLENYYKRIVGIDGDVEYAKKMTDIERKKNYKYKGIGLLGTVVEFIQLGDVKYG